MKRELTQYLSLAATLSILIALPALSDSLRGQPTQVQAPMLGSRAQGKSPVKLKVTVSNQDMRAFSTLTTSKDYKSPLLISPYGDTVTTIVPADWMMQTGQHGPRLEETTYTSPHMSAIRTQQHNWQLLGPMSVVHTGAGELVPRVLMAQDQLHYGIPHRSSGATIMERPGYEHDMSLAVRPSPVPQYIAANRNAAMHSDYSIREAPSRQVIAKRTSRQSIAFRHHIIY